MTSNAQLTFTIASRLLAEAGYSNPGRRFVREVADAILVDAQARVEAMRASDEAKADAIIAQLGSPREKAQIAIRRLDHALTLRGVTTTGDGRLPDGPLGSALVCLRDARACIALDLDASALDRASAGLDHVPA